MMKPLFILLSGLPGSGKSTYRAYPGFDSYIHLSTDDVIEANAKVLGKTYDDMWGDLMPVAALSVNDAFQAATKDSKPIIWDQTNLSVKKRKSVLARLPRIYTRIAVYFEVDEGLRQQRLEARVGKTIPASVDRSMRLSYVRPTIEEGFDFVLQPAGTSFMEGLLAE